MTDASATLTVTVTLHLWWLWAYLAVGVTLTPWYAVRAWRSGSESRRLSFWRYVWWGLFPERAWRQRVGWIVVALVWPLAWWEELR